MALRTVQGVLEAAVRAVVREPVEVIGASRTDAGVHAVGQVAAFTCRPLDPPPGVALVVPGGAEGAAVEAGAGASRGVGWPRERGTERLVRAINARLPEDVLVVGAADAVTGFDPVGQAVEKAYAYTFYASPERPLWARRTVKHVRTRGALDVVAMNAAAQSLVGEHDFAAFAAAGHGRLSTVRTLFACAVEGAGADEGGFGQRVCLTLRGNGFLWNMVRIIAGTLLEVGLGRRPPGFAAAALASRDRAKAGPTLGPEGLCLRWVRYPGEGVPSAGAALPAPPPLAPPLPAP